MAFNPFLSMGEPVAPVEAETLNPFMMGGEEEQVVISSDNPFAASNPFTDFGASMYDSNAGEAAPMDIFGIMGASTKEENVFGNVENEVEFNTNTFVTQPMDFTEPLAQMTKPTQLNLSTSIVDSKNAYSSDEESQKPKLPPLPARPLPPETQNLILSVTGHMDYTSSHLLDRIPPTRTPSPVSMRDLHSPSPTPEPEPFGDMISQAGDNFMDTQAHQNHTPEMVPIQPPITSINMFDVNQNKPTRPARPPPARPQPPPPISHPRPPVPQKIEPKSHDDDINLFDAPVPTIIKPTKEDILSLYSVPKKEEEKQIDFLSDDILDNIPEHNNESSNELSSPNPITVQESTPPGSNLPTDVIATPDHPSSNISIETISAIEGVPDETETFTEPEVQLETDANIYPTENAAPLTFEPTPEAPNNNVYGNIVTDSFGTEELKNPFEAMDTNYPDGVDTAASPFGAPSQSDKNGSPFVAPPSSNFNASLFGEAPQADSSPFGDAPTTDAATNDGFLTSNAFGDPIMKSDSGFGESLAPDTTVFPQQADAFDAFSAKFDAFSSNEAGAAGSAWGAGEAPDAGGEGFDGDEAFDSFLSMQAPPPAPAATPAPVSKDDSQDSDEGNFNVFIKPKNDTPGYGSAGVPVLAPPPRPQALPESPRVNPFDNQPFAEAMDAHPRTEASDSEKKSGSETPPTPLFDEDISQPLEDFPRVVYNGPGWEMQLRQPNKKKITGQRFWKKIFVKLAFQGDNPVVQLYNSPTDKEPFQELPLQACYSVSEIGAQQYDQFGKIFTVKLQYIFYKERPGVRPGQVTKAERITNKLSQFAAYAIQGDYQGVKEFGSDLKKLGLPVEHAPQISQLFKIGSLNYEDVKQFSVCVEEALFKLHAHRDRALTYKMEEVQITAVDELFVEQDAEGSVLKQIARVRLFFLGFLSGMPDIELGVNDLRRQGREVVGRHDIIPVVTEEWIRVEDTEFHACVQPEEFTKTQIIKFKPPDACYIELMRFRIRPPKNRELPLQLKAVMCVTGNKVELRADVLVPGFASRKLGQVPCEDVMIRFPIPECWIYLFRVEKHFRYGSVKSAHRRTGKIKGIERFLGTVETLQESLIEVTSGQAKYEHQHRAIVWRMPRLPKEGQGAYTTHNLVCRMALTSYDQIPPELAKFAYVEFTMPATQVSHMTVRSVSLQNHDSDEPPEKYVRYLARHEYTVGIEHTTGSSTAAYVAATVVPTQKAQAAAPLAPVPQAPSSDSDSD